MNKVFIKRDMTVMERNKDAQLRQQLADKRKSALDSGDQSRLEYPTRKDNQPTDILTVFHHRWTRSDVICQGRNWYLWN